MEILEIIGTAAFAISGAMIAIDKGADIFGVLFLALITALGGGVIRDTVALCAEIKYVYSKTAHYCILSDITPKKR